MIIVGKIEITHMLFLRCNNIFIKGQTMCCRADICVLSIILTISLIIGLPTMIIGCNDFSCPLQEKVVSSVDRSYYVEDECMSQTCISYDKEGLCTNYMYSTYDCSYWSTYVTHEKGSCNIRGKYNKGVLIEIFVNKLDGTCSSNIATISNLPIVGVIFLSISGITLILMFILPFLCECKN